MPSIGDYIYGVTRPPAVMGLAPGQGSPGPGGGYAPPLTSPASDPYGWYGQNFPAGPGPAQGGRYIPPPAGGAPPTLPPRVENPWVKTPNPGMFPHGVSPGQMPMPPGMGFVPGGVPGGPQSIRNTTPIPGSYTYGPYGGFQNPGRPPGVWGPGGYIPSTSQGVRRPLYRGSGSGAYQAFLDRLAAVAG